MRARELAGLLVAVAAHVSVAPIAYAFSTTVGGRPVDLDSTLSVREVIEENGSTKHERTQEQLRVRLAAALTSWLRFDSTTATTNGGPTMKADRSGVYHLYDTFQDVSPSVDFEEAYIDVFLPSVDLRIGKQKVAWGKLDRVQLNDLINPLTYTDPFLEEENERKIGVPALQASYYLPAAAAVPPESRLTAVWVPKYLPYRFSLATCEVPGPGATTANCDVERWFPPAAVPPPSFTIPAGVITLPNGQQNAPFTVPLAFHTRNGSQPGTRLENSEIGLRYSALVRDVDFALYYFHGFDTQPAFNLTAEAVGQRNLQNLSGATTLSPSFHQINSGGGDFAYAFDRFTLRGETAFFLQRPFGRDLRSLISDPSQLAPALNAALKELLAGAGSAPVALPPAFVLRDAVQWGFGADYIWEGYLLLLQIDQTNVLHNDTSLLIKNTETRLLSNLRKHFVADRLQTQLVAVHSIESDYTLVRPRLLYQFTDHIAAEIGYLFIAGRSESLVGQYKRNGEGWVRFEYKL